ncbi:McrB family protein [Flavobacterium flavigenum]|uniref:McrB family protein n=1 Tax=Flavobacterium flavigenum TaxID=3003258 RepID=UPI0022AC204C|nr:AAA family ATPase [Flavobacterium flavigenum]
MTLLDVSELGNELKNYFLQNTEWPEITFNSIDKDRISELPNVEKVESHSIKFRNEDKIIFIPSQYILLALKVKDFAKELIKYTDAFEHLKSLNDKNIIGEFINSNKDLTNTNGLTSQDLELFKEMFSSSNPKLNFGAKSIINGENHKYKIRSAGDFFGSVVLKIINVPDVSSAKLGSIIYSLAKRPNLYDYLENRFSTIHNNEQLQNDFNCKNTIFYGAPGTGKSYIVNEKLKSLDPHFYERITFHPEFDNSSFVGGYKPKNEKDEAGNDSIKYKFVPQAFTNIYVKAWNDQANRYFLAIEEINRGNCAEIFGDIFQLLDRKSNYTVSPSYELKEYLEDTLTNEEGLSRGLKLPPNLTIYATMNTSDQSLFPMDSAFKRRWDWEYISICYDDVPENESYGYEVKIDDTTSFKWIDFIREVNKIIKNNPNLGMDKCIGNYFIKSETKEISLKEFINKAIFYLWNDVFKDEDSSESLFEKNVCYEDFFPIDINAKDQILKILKRINIEPTTV